MKRERELFSDQLRRCFCSGLYFSCRWSLTLCVCSGVIYVCSFKLLHIHVSASLRVWLRRASCRFNFVINFSRTLLVWTERAQSTAWAHECGPVFKRMHAHVCVCEWVQVWDASVRPTASMSIFAQYSEIWRKATCFNIYGCGQTWNPRSLSKLPDSMHAHALSAQLRGSQWKPCTARLVLRFIDIGG